MWEEEDDYYEQEQDTSFHSEPNRKDYNSGSSATSGSTGSFKCSECGSYNTGQSTFADWCNSCGYSYGY